MWPMWLIHAPVLKLLRTAPVITIKQLLSLDIIKAGQYVEGGVNPKDPRLGVEEGGVVGSAECGQTDIHSFSRSLPQVEAIRENPHYHVLYIQHSAQVFRHISIERKGERVERRTERFQEYSGEVFNQRFMLIQNP